MTEPDAGGALGDVIGTIPYRMAFAGGWIDQPFMSRLNPDPSGSMVVVSLEPDRFFMERCGMATGTRNVARQLWGRSCRGETRPSWCASCTRLRTRGNPNLPAPRIW